MRTGRLLLALLCLCIAAAAQDDPKPSPLEEARARNEALRQESTQRAQQIENNKQRLDAFGQRVERAKATLKQVQTWYAPDTPDYERPSDDEVLFALRRLEEESDPDEFARALDRVTARRATLDERRSEIDAALATIDATFAPVVKEAPEEADGARQEREVLLRGLREQCTELLKQNFTLLERMTAEHKAKRNAFLELRQQNLFLRGRSELTVESLERARDDLADLPGWLGSAGRAIGAYVTDGDHLAPLLRLAGLLGFVLVVLLLVRRGLRGRARKTPEEKQFQRRLFGVLAGVVPPLGFAFLGWLALTSGAGLLPDLAPGVDDYLRALGWVAGGFLLLRAAARWLARPRADADGETILPPRGARYLALGIRLVMWISIVALPVLFGLERLGYENAGALEALWLAYKVLLGLVVVLVLLRKRFLLSLLPSQDGRGVKLFRLAILYVRPFAVLLVPVLLVLDALSYDILAGLIMRFSVGALVATIAGAVLYRMLRTLADAWLEKAFEDATTKKREAATDALHFAVRLGMFLLVLWGFLQLSGSDLDELRSFLDIPLPLQAADNESPITWWNVVVGLALFFVFIKAVAPARQFLHEIVLRKASMDEGLRYAISTLFGYTVLAAGVYFALQQVVDLSNLGYVVAALSVGLGFGLQEIVSNFVSGLILLFERPLKVGDLVQVGDKQGIVRRINIRATTVQTPDNVYLLVPNREFITQTVVNFAHDDPKLRIHVGVGVSYSSDTAKVRETLREVAKANKNVLNHPVPKVRFTGFGNSSLDFELLAWISRPPQQYDIGSDLCFEIFAAFDKAGIEIPFPQRDLHVRSIVPASIAKALAPEPEETEEPEEPEKE